MSDWPSIVISAASGLTGAGVGGYAAWMAAVRSGDDARALAAAERAADDEDRRKELARNAAREIRTIVDAATRRLYNIARADREVRGGSMDRLGGDRVIESAKSAVDEVRREITRDAYLLPDEIRDRLENLYVLMSRVTYGDLTDDRLGIDVQTYAKYLRFSLQALVRGDEIPAHSEPPDLSDPNRPLWAPDPLPAGWTSKTGMR